MVRRLGSVPVAVRGVVMEKRRLPKGVFSLHLRLSQENHCGAPAPLDVSAPELFSLNLTLVDNSMVIGPDPKI